MSHSRININFPIVIGSAFLFLSLIAIMGFIGGALGFEVCGRMEDSLKSELTSFLTFLFISAFVGATVISTVKHAKKAMGLEGSGIKPEEIWESRAMKAAIELPLGLYFIDMGLRTTFDVTINCFIPLV